MASIVATSSLTYLLSRLFSFFDNDSQKKKSVACFHWMPKLFRRVDDFFCCHLWLDIRSRTYLILGWNYFWRSIHNFQHLLFLEIYRLFFFVLLQGTFTSVGLLFQTISISNSLLSRVRNKHTGTLINFWGFFQGLRPY